MKLTFLGATNTVTGSKYLVEDEHTKILIDCGLFQGQKDIRNRNWQDFPILPSSIDAVVLTHAHIDHIGYLPLLVKNGFKGPIYCTSATADLCDILLPDSAYLQEEDAKLANKHKFSRHTPALPLYYVEDAYNALELIKPVSFGVKYKLNEFLSFEYTHAGHILGAASVTLDDGQTKTVFSGDLGRPNDPIIREPARIQEADYLILESTYGDRSHEDTDPLDQIEKIINKTVQNGGSVVIPAFAVGRAQSIMFYIYELKKQNRIPNVAVYLDSPMAISATRLLKQHSAEHRLSYKTCKEMCQSVIYTESVEQSKAIYNKNNNFPKIIISASGMATGGRVLHHLKHFIAEKQNAIVFVGFQASGTRGAKLISGDDQVQIHGFQYPVRAEIYALDSISAHADYKEIIAWLKNFRKPPHTVFLTHGEEEAIKAFKQKIEKQLGWNVEIPSYLEEIEL